MRDQMRISKSTIQCVEPTFDCRNHRQFAKSIFFDLTKGFSLFFFRRGYGYIIATQPNDGYIGSCWDVEKKHI